MTCRICGKQVQPEYRPFCSRHCADLDLAHWLRGSYVTSRPLSESDLSDLDRDGNDAEDTPLKR
jgi:endogenous inhibitor of DNA gyrase (YacG/DUF329 family)